MDSTGHYIATAGNNTLSVRPAFHLNLKKAEEASNSFTVPPTAMTSVYDAEEVDLSGESWYRENFTDYVDISIEYFKKDETVGKAVDKIIDAGTYKVKFTIKDSSLHKWKSGDSGSAERIMTYTVTPKKLPILLSTATNGNCLTTAEAT